MHKLKDTFTGVLFLCLKIEVVDYYTIIRNDHTMLKTIANLKILKVK